MEPVFKSNVKLQNQRLGIHYYQDTLNYKDSDLIKWLPRFNDLNISWLVLLSDIDRAIPEQFVKGIIDSGINPIIHFKQQPQNPIAVKEIEPILNAYGKWGVKQVIFYDKPNIKNAWQPTRMGTRKYCFKICRSIYANRNTCSK